MGLCLLLRRLFGGDLICERRANLVRYPYRRAVTLRDSIVDNFADRGRRQAAPEGHE